MKRRAWAGSVFVLLGLGSCGARTTLKSLEPCGNEGAERECSNRCGAGIQSCESGFWRECSVLPVERLCQDQCGEGTQVCEDEVWGQCRVPVTSRPCDNSCGRGSQTCEDDKWNACEVEPTVEACSNDCGGGSRTCQNDRWGACEVPPVSVECEDVCGQGWQACLDGTWRECEVEPVPRECSTACGNGTEWCERGRFGACDAPQPRPPKLKTTVRDFLDTHPDFENDALPGNVQYGMVEELLGADDKPVRISGAASISSDESFYSWYRDVAGVNQSVAVDLQLAESSDGNALFEYRNNAFFPIDDQLFGDQGRSHNYHFTLEASTEFRYVGGEVFTFIGDDDLWIFINRRLAIDLGGLHQSMQRSVYLDTITDEFELEVGELYPLHIFFAERHTIDSNFTIETSIAGPPECD